MRREFRRRHATLGADGEILHLGKPASVTFGERDGQPADVRLRDVRRVQVVDAGLRGRFDNILESIGMLTIGLVALELAQTVFEEEVQRDVKVSGPTRVRRYLSRFLVVIVIALSIETR